MLPSSLRSETTEKAMTFVIGAVVAMICSFTVNCTLVEITINGFFAFYFGVLFLVVAGFIVMRVRTNDHPHQKLLIALAVLVAGSGLSCFLLERNWFVGVSAIAKAPLYTLLGVSVTFAMLFSILDMMNYCSQGSRSGIVSSPEQVMLVIGTSVFLGAFFGFVFALMDIEDERLWNMRGALMREERICYPVAALVGGAAALMNARLKSSRQTDYDAVPRTDQLDDGL